MESPPAPVRIRVLSTPRSYTEVAGDAYLGHQKSSGIETLARRFWQERERSAGPATEPVKGDWWFVPVEWTALENRYRRLPRWAKKHLGLHGFLYRRLNRWLHRVTARHGRCFTVVQHDLGLELNKYLRPPRELLVFGAGGVGDVPIPLWSDAREHPSCSRDLLASFKGAIDHPFNDYPWRRAMRDVLAGEPDMVVLDSADPRAATYDYLELIARSRYSLCPRGFGRTSFRLQEAMQLGSVPVFIHAGDTWLPFTDELDWTEFCVFADYRRLGDLAARLRSIPEQTWVRMSTRAKEVAASRYTPEAIFDYVERFLSAAGEAPVPEIRRRAEMLRRPLYKVNGS